MSSDFKQKEPSKTEKMIYELAMAQNSMEKGLWSTSTLVIVMGILTGQDPQKIAELMVNGDEQIKKFSKKVNEEIKILENKKHEGHDHDKGEHMHSPIEDK